MEVSDEEYAEAIRTVYKYRKERNLDFYLPINISMAEEISIDELKRFLAIQQTINESTSTPSTE